MPDIPHHKRSPMEHERDAMDDAEILKLLEGVTPGPWEVCDETVIWTCLHEPPETTYDLGTPVAEARRLKSFAGPAYSEGEAEANARFIAAARTLVPALLARAQKAEVERDQWREAYERAALQLLGEAEKMGEAVGELHAAEAALLAVARGALEEAVDACADYPRVAPDESEWTRYDEQIEHSQRCIRALDPADIVQRHSGGAGSD